MQQHDLKTDADAFAALWAGVKTAELRRDDRGFEVGDRLALHETDGQRGMIATVTHVERDTDARYGLRPGFVMLSLGQVQKVYGIRW